MFDENYYDNLPHGEERLTYLKKCIAEADNAHDIGQMMHSRYAYMEEAEFYDDRFKALIMFPELLKLYEENPDVIEPGVMIYPFEWIVEFCSDYWQISLEQIEPYLDRFREFLQKNGYGPEKYYLRKSCAYLFVDLDKSVEALREYEKAEKDSRFDDINGLSSVIHRDMQTGNIEKAMKLLNDLLKKHDIDAFPDALFGDIAHEFAKRGMYSEADHYADIMLRQMDSDKWISNLEQVAYVITVKTFTDIPRAYDMFCECAGMFSGIRFPTGKFTFANAAYHLFSALEKQGVNEIHARLSSDFELFSAEGVYSTGKLKEFFRDTAKDIAKKFDKRNGNTMFSEFLAFQFPDAPEMKIELPLYGAVTPEHFEVGVLFENELPSFDDVGEALRKVLGSDNVKVVAEEDNKSAYIAAYDSSNVKLIFGAVYDEAPDSSQYKCLHYIPDNALDNIGRYKKMLVLISDNRHADRFEDIRRMLVLADMLNTGGCPIVYNLLSMLMYPSEWLKYQTLSKAPPDITDCVRYWQIETENDPDTRIIMTSGMELFGSRELAVTGVTKDRFGTVMWLLEKLVSAISFTILPDEGNTVNTGIEYDGSAYIRMGWTRYSPEDNETEFAEPLLYLGITNKEHGKRITEILDDDREKMRPLQHRISLEYEEIRCRNLFPYALEYFDKHDCKMLVGICHKIPTGTVYLDCEMNRDERTAVVIDEYPDYKGMILPVSADNIYFFRIYKANGEFFDSDEMYILMQEDKHDRQDR